MKNLLMLSTLFTLAWAATTCDKGFVQYENVCAAIPAPADSGVSAKPSDDKVPSDKMPSYEREGVSAATPPSLAGQDATQDAEKAKATEEGKAAAGIKIKGE